MGDGIIVVVGDKETLSWCNAQQRFCGINLSYYENKEHFIIFNLIACI
jgi:hypothetical protein